MIKDRSNLRITVDTLEDFELIKLLIEKFDADQLGTEQICEILENNPELAQINGMIAQKPH